MILLVTEVLFIAPVSEVLLCKSSFVAWRLIDSDSTRLYTSERRVPMLRQNCIMSPRSSRYIRSMQCVVLVQRISIAIRLP